MTNKFKLDLPENSFGFPCNICANRNQPVDKCRDCAGYGGTCDFPIDKGDLRSIMEAPK
jgi:hypothetical protein